MVSQFTHKLLYSITVIHITGSSRQSTSTKPTSPSFWFVSLQSWGNILMAMLLHKLCNNALALDLPFLSVGFSILEELIRPDTKDSTITKLLCQRNDIEIIETNS